VIAARMTALHANEQRPDGGRYTDQWVADRAGCTRAYITNLRNGRNYSGKQPPNPSVDFLARLADAYGKHRGYFLDDEPADQIDDGPVDRLDAQRAVREAMTAAGITGIQMRQFAANLLDTADYRALEAALRTIAQADDNQQDGHSGSTAPPFSSR